MPFLSRPVSVGGLRLEVRNLSSGARLLLRLRRCWYATGVLGRVLGWLRRSARLGGSGSFGGHGASRPAWRHWRCRRGHELSDRVLGRSRNWRAGGGRGGRSEMPVPDPESRGDDSRDDAERRPSSPAAVTRRSHSGPAPRSRPVSVWRASSRGKAAGSPWRRSPEPR